MSHSSDDSNHKGAKEAFLDQVNHVLFPQTALLGTKSALNEYERASKFTTCSWNALSWVCTDPIIPAKLYAFAGLQRPANLILCSLQCRSTFPSHKFTLLRRDCLWLRLAKNMKASFSGSPKKFCLAMAKVRSLSLEQHDKPASARHCVSIDDYVPCTRHKIITCPQISSFIMTLLLLMSPLSEAPPTLLWKYWQ